MVVIIVASLIPVLRYIEIKSCKTIRLLIGSKLTGASPRGVKIKQAKFVPSMSLAIHGFGLGLAFALYKVVHSSAIKQFIKLIRI